MASIGNENSAPTHIGEVLRSLREARGYTQKQIAEILHVSFQQIQKYETGHNRLPIDKLYVLKQFYNLPFDVFFIGMDFRQEAFTDMWDSEHIHHRFLALEDDNLKAKIYRVVEILMEA